MAWRFAGRGGRVGGRDWDVSLGEWPGSDAVLGEGRV